MSPSSKRGHVRALHIGGGARRDLVGGGSWFFEDIMAEGVDIGGPSAVCMKKSESSMEFRLLPRMVPGLEGNSRCPLAESQQNSTITLIDPFMTPLHDENSTIRWTDPEPRN